MSPNWIAVSLLPLIVVVVIVLECSRLRCARRVQRRLGADRPHPQPTLDARSANAQPVDPCHGEMTEEAVPYLTAAAAA